METIEFDAVVSKVQTLSDGGLRFTFDAAESEVLSAAQLMECKRAGVVLRMTIEPAADDAPHSGDYWSD